MNHWTVVPRYWALLACLGCACILVVGIGSPTSARGRSARRAKATAPFHMVKGAIIPGVVADPSRPSLFISMNPYTSAMVSGTRKKLWRKNAAGQRIKDGIVAINPINGKLRWHSRAAKMPVVRVGRRLIALGGRNAHLGIVILDTRTGRKLATCSKPPPKLGFKFGSKTSGWGRSFGGHLVKGRPIIAWSVTHRAKLRGARPLRPEPAIRVSGAGAVVVNPRTGCASVYKSLKWPSSSGLNRWYRIGRTDVRLTVQVRGVYTQLRVRRRRAGVRLPDRFLKWRRGQSVRWSHDFRHYCLVKRRRTSTGGWVHDTHILDLASGAVRRIPGRPYGSIPGGFMVMRGVVLVTSRTIVEALSRTGKPRWKVFLTTNMPRRRWPPGGRRSR